MMQIRWRKQVSGVMKFFLGALCGVGVIALSTVAAQEAGAPETAPVNPAFMEHRDIIRNFGASGAAADGHALGLLPSPVYLPHLTERTESLHPLLGVVLFPSSYDLRTTGKLTPVRDQGACGSCWSFGAMGSLESSLMPAEAWDFSENNLKNTAGFDYGHCDGGNATMSMAYLARWGGPVSEADDPYDPVSSLSPTVLSVQKHMQEVIIVPARASSTDNDGIKQAVMTYGGLQTSMFWDNPSISPNYGFYYNGGTSTNHAVVIVGWDDDYSSANFNTPPPGNGAFLIRNSWGEAWGLGGYFYISYYDTAVGRYNYAFNGAEATANFSRIYQYDPLGWVSSVGYGATTAWFANIFPAVGNENVSAVSFYAASPNSSYEIYIYTNVTTGPISGTLANSTTGALSSAGYHTVALSSPVPVTAGQSFSAVVKLTTPGYNWPVPFEYVYSGYSSAASASAGQSFISGSGTSWTDLTAYYPTGNVCLKAFTTFPIAEVSPASLSFADRAINTISGAETVTVSNTGSEPLVITAISKSGANAMQFSQTNTCPLGGPGLAVGASCTIKVKFKPTTAGAKSATIAINVQSPAESKTVTLTGTGLAPVATVTPAALSFSDTVLNTSSTPKWTKVKNTGNIPLVITGIAKGGTNAKQFFQTNTCPIGGPGLAAGASCLIKAWFKPTTEGAKSATITITVDPPAVSKTVTLTGTGILCSR